MASTTYIAMVETMYRLHYERWYKPFEREPDRYTKIVQACLARIRTELADSKTLVVNGPEILLPATTNPAGMPPLNYFREFATYSIAAVMTIAGSVAALSFLTSSNLLLSSVIVLISLAVYVLIISIFAPATLPVVDKILAVLKALSAPRS